MMDPMMPHRQLLTCTLLLFVLLVLMSCQQPEPLPPLLEVGQRQLSLQQFNNELSLSYPNLAELAEQEKLLLRTQLVHRLIERELILGEADRTGVQISPDELDAAMMEMRGSYTADGFQQVLQEAGQTEESWKAALKLRLQTIKVSEAVLAPAIKVDEKTLEKYYLGHKEEFRRPAELRARQMLFETREDAEKILKQLKAGADFAALARKYSLSPDREDGGNLGYFSKGQLPPEFDEVLFRLPVRQFSDPVESPYGIHLFVVERRRRAGLRPYAAVREEIKAKLTQEQEELAFQNWLEELHDSTQISVNWQLLSRATEN